MTPAYVLRLISRQVRAWWCERQAAFEEWWERHLVGSQPKSGFIYALPWETGRGPCYLDGRADVMVDVLNDETRCEGFEADLVQAYLRVLHRPAPQEVRTWK